MPWCLIRISKCTNFFVIAIGSNIREAASQIKSGYLCTCSFQYPPNLLNTRLLCSLRDTHWIKSTDFQHEPTVWISGYKSNGRKRWQAISANPMWYEQGVLWFHVSEFDHYIDDLLFVRPRSPVQANFFCETVLSLQKAQFQSRKKHVPVDNTMVKNTLSLTSQFPISSNLSCEYPTRFPTEKIWTLQIILEEAPMFTIIKCTTR